MLQHHLILLSARKTKIIVINTFNINLSYNKTRLFQYHYDNSFIFMLNGLFSSHINQNYPCCEITSHHLMQNFLWTLSYSSFINAINPLIVTGQVSPAKHSASLTSKSLTHLLDELPVPGNVFNTLQAFPSIFFPLLPGGLI